MKSISHFPLICQNRKVQNNHANQETAAATKSKKNIILINVLDTYFCFWTVFVQVYRDLTTMVYKDFALIMKHQLLFETYESLFFIFNVKYNS